MFVAGVVIRASDVRWSASPRGIGAVAASGCTAPALESQAQVSRAAVLEVLLVPLAWVKKSRCTIVCRIGSALCLLLLQSLLVVARRVGHMKNFGYGCLWGLVLIGASGGFGARSWASIKFVTIFRLPGNLAHQANVSK